MILPVVLGHWQLAPGTRSLSCTGTDRVPLARGPLKLAVPQAVYPPSHASVVNVLA
jgi:hypothetical protein